MENLKRRGGHMHFRTCFSAATQLLVTSSDTEARGPKNTAIGTLIRLTRPAPVRNGEVRKKTQGQTALRLENRARTLRPRCTPSARWRNQRNSLQLRAWAREGQREVKTLVSRSQPSLPMFFLNCFEAMFPSQVSTPMVYVPPMMARSAVIKSYHRRSAGDMRISIGAMS